MRVRPHVRFVDVAVDRDQRVLPAEAHAETRLSRVQAPGRGRRAVGCALTERSCRRGVSVAWHSSVVPAFNTLIAASAPKPHLTQVVSGWTAGVFGHAHICEGSVVRATVRGFTPTHAVRRARRRIATGHATGAGEC